MNAPVRTHWEIACPCCAGRMLVYGIRSGGDVVFACPTRMEGSVGCGVSGGPAEWKALQAVRHVRLDALLESVPTDPADLEVVLLKATVQACRVMPPRVALALLRSWAELRLLLTAAQGTEIINRAMLRVAATRRDRRGEA